MNIGSVHDQATEDVETGPKYMDGFVTSQLSPFEAAILSRFIEATPRETMESMQAFVDDPGAYSPNDFGLTRFMSNWRDHVWDAIEEKAEFCGMTPVGAILHWNSHKHIGSQKAFDLALINTAAMFVAESALDGLQRYVLERIDDRFNELASGSV